MTDYTRNLTEAECLCLLKDKIFNLSRSTDSLKLHVCGESYLSNDEKRRIGKQFDFIQTALNETRSFYEDTIGKDVKK